MEQSTPTLSTPSPSPASRLVVLMFTDLVGSTELKDSLGTAGYLPLLRRHDELLREAVSSASGRLQQDTGDGCFAVFPTSSDAVRAALHFQQIMHDEPWPAEQHLYARIGIHLGEVAETNVRQDGGNKMVGLAVDLTARLMSLATGEQILMTRSAFNDARQFIAVHPDGDSVALTWVAHGPYLFKGADEALEVFEVGIKGQSPLSPPGDSEKARRALRAGDEQTLGWRPAKGLTLPGGPHWVVDKKLGEGGFGEVWLARHIKSKAERVFKFCFDAERLRALKREVVLFRLLKEALGDRRDIARVIDWRFDEPPYYVELDYTPAGNLFDWAAGMGGIDKVPLAERLKIIARIATALSAAHSVGILHKDIKPSNVLMVTDAADDTYPRLTDFGIGILTDRTRLEQFNITAAGFTASNISVNDSSRTGTRMYAPPESLADKPHTVQGDVYALGVMLYQMAVGDLVAPLGVGWERNIADEMLREDIKACVEGDPARRLASAAELANRLDHLEERRAQAKRQADQQATAARRKRLLRLATAGALTLIVVVSFASLALLREHGLRTRAEIAERGTRQEEQRAERATTVALEQKALAERRFNDVRNLANTFMFQVHDAIENLAGSTPARRLLVETSLKYLASLEAESGDAPGILREVAVAYNRVGDVLGNPQNSNLGDSKGALEAFNKSLQIRLRLADAEPTNPQAWRDLAAGYSKVGDMLAAMGKTKTALEVYQKSLEITRRLVEAEPGNSAALRNLSFSFIRVGDMENAMGNSKGALAAFEKSLEIRTQLAEAQPAGSAAQHDLSVSFDRVGNMRQALGDTTKAMEAYQKAMDIRTKLADADPTNAAARRDLSISYCNIGDVQKTRGEIKKALEAYGEGLKIDKRQAEADPTSAIAARDLSFSYGRVGDAQALLGDNKTALDNYSKALALAQRLSDADPRSAAFRSNLSLCLSRVGDALTALGDQKAAIDAYKRSLTIDLRMAGVDPNNAAAQRDLSISYNKIGAAQESIGDNSGALETYRKSFEIAQRLEKLDPANVAIQRDMSIAHDRMGDVQLSLRDFKAAIESYRAALAIRARLAQTDATSAEAKRDVGVSHFKVGNALMAQGLDSKGEAAARRACLENAAVEVEKAKSMIDEMRKSGTMAAQDEKVSGILTEKLAKIREVLKELDRK